MGGMYRKLGRAIAVNVVRCTPVGNEQFLRSMIPHHSSAILMCDEARITDPEITRLCEQIVRTQREEIAQMRAIMTRY